MTMKKLVFLVGTAVATAAALWLRRKKTPAVSPLSTELGVSFPVPPPPQEIHGPVEMPLEGDNGLDLVCPSVHLQEDGEFMPANHQDKGETVGQEGGEEHVTRNYVHQDPDLQDDPDEDNDCNMDHLGVETQEEENVGQEKQVRDVLHEEDGLVDTAEGADICSEDENKNHKCFNGDGECDEEQRIVISVEGEGSTGNCQVDVVHVPAEENHESGRLSEVVVGTQVCAEDKNKNQEQGVHDDCNADHIIGGEEHLGKTVQATQENKDKVVGQEGRDEDHIQDVADDQDLPDVEEEEDECDANHLVVEAKVDHEDVGQEEEVRHVLAEDGLVEGVEGGEIHLEDEKKNHGEGVQDGFDGDAECDGVQLMVLAEEGEGRTRNCEVDVVDVPGEDDNEGGFMFDYLSKVVVDAVICLEDENKNQKGVHDDDCNMHHLDVEAEVDEEDAGQGEEVRDVLSEEDGLVDGIESRDICLAHENKSHVEGVQDGFCGDGECDVVQLVVITEEGEGSLEDREDDILDVTPEDDDDSAFMFDHLKDVAMEDVQDEFHGDDECDVEPLVEGEWSPENCEADVLYALGEEEAAIGGEVCTIREDDIQGGFKEDNECVACLTVPAEGEVITADREADGEEGENVDCSQCGMTEEKVVQDGRIDVHQQTTSARESYVPDWKKRNPFLMDQIKALNMKTRQIKAARSYTIGPKVHNDQHARMKEIALRRAKELEEEEKERTRMKKARSLAKLEELNTRILTQSSHENHQFSSRLQVYPRRN